jgi:predicted RNA-binding Zn ribbon-like protein
MITGNPNAAPGELDLIRRFVNTLDVEEEKDRLATRDGLAEWLSEEELPGDGLTEPDRRRAIQLRESLRALLHSNHGEPLDDQAVEALNREAASVPLVVRFTSAGESALAPGGGGVDTAFGTLLAIVFRAMAEGTWPRLKACRANTCQWAFYDHSKNRSATWCSMRVCGNRAKARSYRERRTRAAPG